MDYNTQREKLIMPEYGRYVQKLLKQVKSIPDKEKRSEQVRAVVNAMGTLNPHLREMNDFKHKLWDHVFVISDFDLDIDAPYPPPTSESFRTAPNRIELEDKPLKLNYYGRNIQNMAEALAKKPSGTERDEMVMALAYYMRKQYLIWNKDSVADQTIFNDIAMLSKGQLAVPEGFKMDEVQGELVRQAYFQSKNGQPRNDMGKNYRNKKRKKKPQRF
ncbi:MAG: DUF4290 domain-containing protein [Bacteroidales bacterium]|nr:DUF4290 domain-containing protein [Bacteroidales bacterium]